MAEPRSTSAGHVDDDLAALALGILDADEREPVETHVASCDRCRDLLDGYARTVLQTRRDAPLPPPPPGLWERIEQRIDTPALPARRHPRRRGTPRWQHVVALAAALAIAGLLAWNIVLQVDGRDDNLAALFGETNDVVFTLAAPSPTSTAQGRIFMSDDRTRGVVAVVGLPRLPEGRRYAVWLVGYNQDRVQAGTFTVDGGGNGVASLTLPSSGDWWGGGGPAYAGLAVTEVIEATPDVPAGPDLLAGPLY